MSTSWIKRKTRLATLLQSQGDEQADGLALDRLLHGQSVIGRTPKTAEVDSLRFTQNDLAVVGTLEYGQFSVIDVVNCNINGRVYIRKTIEKRFAYKTRDQCNPQLERDILLRAKTAGTQWAPHLLCAFQSDTHLNLVMDYAEGGTLWDVLESSPDERIPEDDLRWWFPQVVSAIAWCHGQGFAHRDVKPHNFVLTQTSHVQLIDFGSAAPLLPPQSDGSRLIPREHCLVPCGTCDYISPEILQAHEAALVAMEMTEEEDVPVELDSSSGVNPYGAETDWWSMGAMLYEMAYGAAPFFANDIRTTYLKIVDFKKSLKFKSGLAVSAPLQDLIRRLLTDSHKRLGRRGVEQVKSHPFFGDPPWTDLHRLPRPENLHLPIFAYNQPPPPPPEAVPALDSSGSGSGSGSSSSDHSQGFAFSAFFQPSQESSPGLSILRSAPRPNKSILREQAATFFIGFSWGSPKDAFPSSSLSPPTQPHQTQTQTQTPRPLPTRHLTPTPFRTLPPSATPLRYPFATPHKPAQTTPNGFSTLPRASTVRRTAPRRAVSDREAMRQLVDCIGMSAQKKVLAAGRTPRTIGRTPAGGSLRRLGFALGPNGGGGTTKSLRFLPAPIEIGHNSHRRDVAVGEDTTAGSSVDASGRVLDWNMAASAILMDSNIVLGGPQGNQGLVDSTDIWEDYLVHADERDKARAERWREDMDGILIFAGLFSAVTTAFVVDAYKNLQPDNVEMTATLLVRVVAALEHLPNTTAVDVTPYPGPSPTVSLWINALWFVSLLLSVACALAATLVKQWSRKYLQRWSSARLRPGLKGRPADISHRTRVRARAHVYYSTGVDKFGLVLVVVDAIPVVLQLSLFCFIAGLVVFAFVIKKKLAWVILTLAIVITFLYSLVTVLPVLYTSCPYHTPLSFIIPRTVSRATNNPEETEFRLSLNREIIYRTMEIWFSDDKLTEARVEKILFSLIEILQPAWEMKPKESAEAAIKILFDEAVQVGARFPVILRSWSAQLSDAGHNPEFITRGKKYLRLIGLLVKLQIRVQAVHPDLAEKCIYPALESTALVLRHRPVDGTRSPWQWEMPLTAMLLVGLVLRNYHTSLMTVKSRMEGKFYVFPEVQSSVYELLRIRDRLHAILPAYVTEHLVRTMDMNIPASNPIYALQVDLKRALPTFDDVARLGDFVGTELKKVKDACQVFYLTVEMMRRSRRLHLTKEMLEAIDVPVYWTEQGSLDTEEKIRKVMRPMLLSSAQPGLENELGKDIGVFLGDIVSNNKGMFWYSI
ncbi:hypothetical protein OF83DRAFT_1295902 [Amylostereum chailletii]|nr:hypothetical protein OF83DRAFT_1295902 [Amylostereum chailletii]